MDKDICVPGWIDLTFGRLRWEVNTAWRDLLFDARGLRFAEWRERGLLETVKEASHRTVYRVNLPDGIIYLKYYPVTGVRSWLRQLLRLSKARAEFNRTLAVANRRVPTIEALAVGEVAGGESYLITRGLPESWPLSDFYEHARTGFPKHRWQRFRLMLTEELASFAAHMHDVGVLHEDFHTGNILVYIDGDDRPHLHLIDLHKVRLVSSLDWAASCKNLAMLTRWFLQRSSRVDRRRFWRCYLACRRGWSPSPDEERRKARELEQRAWDSCVRHWERRDRRCLANNRHFIRLRHQSNLGWAVRDLPLEYVRPLLADPDAPFQEPGSRILKDGSTSTVAEFSLSIAGKLKRVVYKRCPVVRWRDPWLAMLRSTRALRSWINGHRLLECGLPTARPLAVIHRRRGGLIQESYLLTDGLDDTVPLHKYVMSLTKLPAQARRQRLLQLVEAAAHLVQALHQRALSQRDLKAANILVRAYQPPVPPELFLIDLVGMERWRKLPRSRRVQNLGRLHASFHAHPLVTRTDKLRFLRTYLGWGVHGKGGWKNWWRMIERATDDKIAQNLHRGRPLT